MKNELVRITIFGEDSIQLILNSNRDKRTDAWWIQRTIGVKSDFFVIYLLLQGQIREFEAVLARLKFFKAFYLALVSLEKSEVR